MLMLQCNISKARDAVKRHLHREMHKLLLRNLGPRVGHAAVFYYGAPSAIVGILALIILLPAQRAHAAS
jgi:hypothetical protein